MYQGRSFKGPDKVFGDRGMFSKHPYRGPDLWDWDLTPQGHQRLAPYLTGHLIPFQPIPDQVHVCRTARAIHAHPWTLIRSWSSKHSLPFSEFGIGLFVIALPHI